MDKTETALQNENKETPTATNQAALDRAAEEANKYALPYELELQEPFEIGTTPVTKLVFKNRMRASYVAHLPVGDLKNLKFGTLYPIISKMTGELPEVIDNLGTNDLTQCVKVVSHFLNGGPTTGGKK